jgi:sortase A
MKREPALRWAERALLVVGAALVTLWLGSVGGAAIYRAEAGRRLDAAGRAATEQGGRSTARAAAARREMAASGLVGRLAIPRLRLASVVAEGVDPLTLGRAVGHLPGSALPGEAGSVVLAGHRDTDFSRLRDIRRGDRIFVSTLDGRFCYRVDSSAVVAPERTDAIPADGGRRLVLVTCYPFEWIGPAPRRFVVWATEETASDPAARTTAAVIASPR